MKLVVGLGNPGKEYVGTRHNIGWDAVSRLAASFDASFSTKKEFKAEVATANLNDEKILLVHPLTFMNLSGEAVLAIKQFFKIPLESILVVQDEMDFPVGKFTFLAQGGGAGHNGISSIQDLLGANQVARLRIGIDRPASPIKKEDYVLQHFSKEERAHIDQTLDKTTQAIKDWIQHGLDKAMNTWNGV